MAPSTVIPMFRAPEPVSRHSDADPARRVWERSQEYEDEGSERRSRGAVSVGAAAWWSASLTLPASESGVDGDVVFLHFKRHGETPAGYHGSTEVDFSVPRSEVDAFVTLLSGLVEQARQDAVLAPRAT